MHTDILTPKDLFQKEVRYTIPPFQRPYVWSQDDQWEPLWEDVRNVAENYLEELERSGNNGVEAEQKDKPAFPWGRCSQASSHGGEGYRPA